VNGREGDDSDDESDDEIKATINDPVGNINTEFTKKGR
jgi:hypothetical protein